MTTLEKLIANERLLRKGKSLIINDEEAIIYQNGIPMIFPNTIVTVQGKEGSHKSRFVSEICSAIVSKPDCSRVGLKLWASKKLYVLYIDTERNLTTQLPRALQNIVNCGCYNKHENPPNFSYSSLLDIERKERLKGLKEFVKHKRQKISKGHFVLVIDVISDCIPSFNDVEGNLGLTDYLNDLVNGQDCTVICVIHENPGQLHKARGHLGTELANKSSNVFQVVKKPNTLEEFIEIRYLKSRNTAVPYPIYCTYEKETGGLQLVTGDNVLYAQNSSNEKAPISAIIEDLGSILTSSKNKVELYGLLQAKHNCSERTIYGRINGILKSNTLIIRDGCPFRLARYYEGGQLFFRLDPALEMEEE